MYQSQSGSIIEPLNSLPVPEPVKKKLPIFVIASVVELLVIIILVIVLVILPKGGKESEGTDGYEVDANSLGELADLREMSVSNAEETLLVYADIKKGNTGIDFSLLEKLADSYAVLYDVDKVDLIGANINKVLAVKKKSKAYPYSDMRVIGIETSDKCVEYEFYANFETLHSLTITDGVCESI